MFDTSPLSDIYLIHFHFKNSSVSVFSFMMFFKKSLANSRSQRFIFLFFKFFLKVSYFWLYIRSMIQPESNFVNDVDKG